MVCLSFIKSYSIDLKYVYVCKCMQSLIRLRYDEAENNTIEVGTFVSLKNHTFGMTLWMCRDGIKNN